MTGEREWRQSPISNLAYAIQMDSVRQTNILPSCRLDKSNRQLYEPEDVWAKRAAFPQVDSRLRIIRRRARGKLQKSVAILGTVGALNKDMEDNDRVKEVCMLRTVLHSFKKYKTCTKKSH